MIVTKDGKRYEVKKDWGVHLTVYVLDEQDKRIHSLTEKGKEMYDMKSEPMYDKRIIRRDTLDSL